MKNFRQLIKELPSNRVVAAFGQFQPPTAGHEFLVKTVDKLSSSADHVIYASVQEDKKSNPLSVDRKVYFLKRMFPEMNFQPATGMNTIVEMAEQLNKRYKNITVVAASDKVADYEKQLQKYNGSRYQFESIKVVSFGALDSEDDAVSAVGSVKMCESAKAGNFTQFKKGVPHTLTELDSRRLMNDVRKGMGLEPIRNTINLVNNEIREKYFRGEIFNVGDIVESDDEHFEIVKRHLRDLRYTWLDDHMKTHGPWNKGKQGLQVAWNKGLKIGPCSQESNEKRSKTLKQRYTTKTHHRLGKQPWNKGKKGQQVAWNKGQSPNKMPCPHCGLEVSSNNMTRWHGDNCRNKNTRD